MTFLIRVETSLTLLVSMQKSGSNALPIRIWNYFYQLPDFAVCQHPNSLVFLRHASVFAGDSVFKDEKMVKKDIIGGVGNGEM